MKFFYRKIFKRKYLPIKNKYKNTKKIKTQPQKKSSKFIIISILLFVLILLIILFFISKNIYKKESIYPQDDLTLVSAYYKLKKSKHSKQEYLEWISNIAKLNKSMVFFTNKKFMPIFKEKRPKDLHYKTVFIELEFEEFNAYKNFYNEFNQTFQIDPEYKIHNVPLFIVWAEKCTFLKKAIKHNFFNSKCFYWVDAGYFRESEKEFERYINNWPSTKKCFEDNRVIIEQVRDMDDLEKQKIINLDNKAYKSFTKKINVAGNFFGGQIKNSLKFIDLYYDSIRLFFKKKLFIGNDQNIFAYIAFVYPKVVELIPTKDGKLYSYLKYYLYNY